jgi:hypothetical protein
MIAEKSLALIAVAEGKSADLFWIRMDGAEESCNPDSFIDTFPQLSCVTINDDAALFAGIQVLVTAAVANIGSADVCLVDSSELYAFTRKETVFREILSGAIACLPHGS